MSIRSIFKGECFLRILDPIHKYIVFSEGESRIVDHVIFQRLRYIRQLGFAEFAFPGAVHNRFLHSLGTFHLAGQVFDSLFYHYPLQQKKKKQFRQIVCLSALLHDIGHGPLSHISEKAMPPLSKLNLPFLNNLSSAIHPPSDLPFYTNHKGPRAGHEHYTIKFLLESDLKNKIEDLDVDSSSVAHLIETEVPLADKNFFISEGVDFKPVLKQIISSDVDVDRIDYLQRDSFFCGVDYGLCGHDWILNNLHIHIQNDRAFLAIGEKAIHSVESFLLGRRHMGLALYFHNKMVAMDEMLYHYFSSPDCRFRIPVNLNDYVHCTDDALFEHLKKNVHCNEWAKRIVEKTPYERAFELSYPYVDQKLNRQHLQKIKNYLDQQGIAFIHVSSTSYINYDHPQLANSVDFSWKRGKNDNPKRSNKQGDSNHPVYILNESTKKAVTFYERMKAFNQQNYVHLIDRIYLSPKNCQKIKLPKECAI